MTGILAMSHLGKESFAIKELLALFDHYYDVLYKTNSIPEESAENSSASIEDELLQELAMLKQSASKKSSPPSSFTPYSIGISCNVFIKTPENIIPSHFLSHILSDLASTKRKMTRYTSTLIPFDLVVHADFETIVKGVAKLCGEDIHIGPFSSVYKVFNEVEDSEDVSANRCKFNGKKYKVVSRVRHNTVIPKDELINQVAEAIPKVNNMVDLKSPDLCVMVEVIKGICGLSILSDYTGLKRYNVESIFEPPVSGPPSVPKKRPLEPTAESLSESV
ncbi:THUMP domain-containing protein 1 [Nowakowskiella sp. JEL0407]|nr:THUMP domain-containing protein 1 [Nowakowskiella sp. JEL0407]